MQLDGPAKRQAPEMSDPGTLTLTGGEHVNATIDTDDAPTLAQEDPQWARLAPIRRAPVPHAPEAERALLGAMLGISDEATAAGLALEPTDFYGEAHPAIHAAIARVTANGAKPDVVTVGAELRATGELDLVGGYAALTELQANTPYSGNAGAYAAIIAEAARLRRTQIAADEVASTIRRGEDPAQALERLDGVRQQSSTTSNPDADVVAFIAEDEPDFEWLVPGLLERRERLILTGGEGRGKSTWLRQFAVQVGAGIHPFDGKAIEPVRVFLLDLENGRALVRRKIRPLVLRANEEGGDCSGVLVHVRPEGLDLTTTDDQAWLAERLRANRPELFITGPIYKLAEGDPNEEAPAKAVTAFLDRMRSELGFALILEAHTPHDERTERPFGASLWKRWPEFGIYLDAVGTLRHWRGSRDEREWPRSLRRGGDWPWTVGADVGIAPSAPVSSSEKAVNALWYVLHLMPGIYKSGNEWRTAAREAGFAVRNTDWAAAFGEVRDSLTPRKQGNTTRYAWFAEGEGPEPDPTSEEEVLLESEPLPWSGEADPFDRVESFER